MCRISWRLALVFLSLCALALAQDAPQPAPPAQMSQPHPWKDLLTQSLDREARCRQALGWLGQDCNVYQGANVHLMQEELERLKAQVDELSKRLDACTAKEKAHDEAPQQ